MWGWGYIPKGKGLGGGRGGLFGVGMDGMDGWDGMGWGKEEGKGAGEEYSEKGEGGEEGNKVVDLDIFGDLDRIMLWRERKGGEGKGREGMGDGL